ncbi:MAG: TonB-dependent receptor [Reichenbachiella sp.]|uniref:SusC/RagA family TonB-linked outer membrane protein n=1 Tax=Reichenbachiella sp. TaxID=2184521 RepID=UPI00329A1666
MKKTKHIMLMVLSFLLVSSLALAQNARTVSGKVISSDENEGLPGVSIVVQGTTTGTITDLDGNYSLEVPDNAILEFSYVGYALQTVNSGTRTVLDITMEVDAETLDEIVVVGYGTQEKKTVIGSISTADGAELKKSPQPNLSNSFAGRISGLVANTSSGEPGFDGSRLLIRGVSSNGDNSPLIVIDGVAGRMGGLDRLDPNDIESVSVLKDASAAIYGARAANGVIIVTTKRGSSGAPELSFSYNHGFVRPTRLPDMADAPTYARTQNEIAYYNNPGGGFNQAYTEEEIGWFSDGSDPLNYANTDWLDEVIAPVSHQDQYNLSLNGGNENVQYFVSLGRRTQEGIYKDGALDFEQWNLRSNIDIYATDNLKIGVDLAARQEEAVFPTDGAESIFRFAYRGYPTEPSYYPGIGYSKGVEDAKNPLVMVTDIPGTDKQPKTSLNSLMKLDYTLPFLESVTIGGWLAIDKTFKSQKKFETPWTVYQINNSTDPVSYDEVQGGPIAPQLYELQENETLTTANASINFQENFDKHNISAFAAYEQSEYEYNWFDAFRRGFLSDAIPELSQGGSLPEESTNDGGSMRETRRNVFGRVTYNYDQRYLLEVQFRYDGSSIFPNGKRYGFFPSASIGWRVSEESWFAVDAVNNLKLRASYGQLGNDRVASHQYLNSYQLNPGGFVLNGASVGTYGINQLANPNITWETNDKLDIGLEVGLFDKFTLEADYFLEKRNNLLTGRIGSLPWVTGIINDYDGNNIIPDENLGKVENEGIEVQLGYQDQVGNVQVYADANFTYNRNKVIFLDDAEGIPDYQTRAGKSLGSDLYYEAIGIFRSEEQIASMPSLAGNIPGDLIYRDVNEDGVIDGNDRVRKDITNVPRYIFGFNGGLAFKNFDFSFLVQGQAESSQYILQEAGTIGNYTSSWADNRWSPTNPNGTYPRVDTRTSSSINGGLNQNDFWLVNTAFIRIKNVELGYNLPKIVLDKVGMSAARVYVNALNLATFSKAKDFDPEGDNSQGQFYPQHQIFNIGASIKF